MSQTLSQALVPEEAKTQDKPRLHLQHIRELDGIRGIAALAVFAHHVMYTSIPHPEQWNSLVFFLSSMGVWGAYGVDLFFILSGFLITSILLVDRPRPHFYWNFYWKRALRIFPLYAVSLVCLAVFFPETRRYVVLSALFLANFTNLFYISGDGPYWTLAIEEQFYLIWPQFAKRLTVKHLQQIGLAIAVGCLMLRLSFAYFGHHNLRLTFLRCDGLGLGALLACQQFQRNQSPDTPRRKHFLGLFLLTIAGFVLTLLTTYRFSGKAGMVAEDLQITGVNLLGYLLIRLVVQHSNTRWLAPLRGKVLTFFGLISYCFYMSHLYVLRAYDHFVGSLRTGDMTHYVVRCVAILGITVVLCVISRYTIELPAMSLRRYVLKTK